MIQLKVYDSQSKTSQHWIDLYETQPIKLNLSIEDITNAEAKSVFSRTFRVPATSNNNEFFNHAFLIDGIDYDVTVKKPAEIIVDGAEFRQGHIRLQRIFINGAQDKIDYEIIFLGETRDFSSAVGDSAMCDLNIAALSHTVSFQNIAKSWSAYPSDYIWNDTTDEFDSQTPTLTSGLKNGDIVYPLIDFGNSYDDNGAVEQARIGLDGSNNFTVGSGGGTFNPLKSLSLDRFKPMIRAKRLIDEIFANAGYTFTSIFFDTDLFKQIYVSAFGNEAAVSLSLESNSTNTMVASTTQTQQANDSVAVPVNIQGTVNDPSSGNTNTSDGKNYQYPGAASYYVAPVTGQYIITASANWTAWFDNFCSFPGQPVAGRLSLRSLTGLTTYATGAFAGGAYASNITVSGSITLNAGDIVQVFMETEYSTCQAQINSAEFNVVAAPGNALPTSSLDCSYKQIDFIKDLLTSFRLVMSPDPTDARNFIIEPFVDYVASGDLYDWSDKLIRDKDFIIEPLFNTQSDEIDFKHEDDGDFINIYHTQAYKNAFGYLQFDSGNELLKGTRNIETKWAPTPVTQLQGAGNTSRFIIPQIHVQNSGDAGTEHLPIKPKTRFLFYNGLEEILTNSSHWHMEGAEPTALDYYPLASYYNEWPMTVDSQVLNWNVDVPYWGTNVGGYNGLITQRDLYNTYWSGYINSLYDKNARRVTAYFTLNNVDLQTFSFDDVIFIDGVYYRPEKINDAQIGVTGPVKVQLIKLLNYVPVPIATDALNYTITPAGPGCFGGSDGQITYVFSNPVAFPVTWSSSSGDTGTFNINPGLIDNQTPGTYSITVTDFEGRTATDTVVIPQASAAQLSATLNITNNSDCDTADGGVVVTPTGGTANYTILWNDGSTNFTRTNLAIATYTFTITDANGCTFSGSALVSCQVIIPPGDISYIREYYVGGLCQGETVGDSIDVVMVRVNSGNTPAEPTDGFYCYDGDWASLQSQYGTAQNTLVLMDQDNTCNQSDWYYSATSFNDALRRPFDGCFCPNTNGFSGQIQLIGTNPYIFVAQT
jgi:hypothetical protein